MGCGNHQRVLSGALAHRNLFQAHQAESAHQDLRRNQQECGTHADMDSHDSHFVATVPSYPLPLQSAYVQLGDIYPHSFDEPFRLMDLVEPDGNERGQRHKYKINGDIGCIENAPARKIERFQTLLPTEKIFGTGV